MKVYLRKHYEMEFEYTGNGLNKYPLKLQSLNTGFKYRSSNPTNPFRYSKPVLLFIQVFIL